MTDYSHGDVPWLIHQDGEKISYESVFYRDDKYSVRNYDDELFEKRINSRAKIVFNEVNQ